MILRRALVLRSLRAFTLIEVMVSVAILAILLAIVIFYLDGSLQQRRVDSDYKQLGALLVTAQGQAKSMGSGQGGLGRTCIKCNPCVTCCAAKHPCSGSSPLVYVSFAPCANAATSIAVYYTAMHNGTMVTQPLDQMTLAPDDAASFSPAPCGMVAYSPNPCPTTGGLLAGYNGTATSSSYTQPFTVTVQGQGNSTAPHAFTWDSNTGGVTLSQ